jgi:hypothetical protein
MIYELLQHHTNTDVNRYALVLASSNHTGPISGTHQEPQSLKTILTVPTESDITHVWTST